MVLKAPLEVLGLGALGCEASARHERREEIRVLHHDLGPEHILGFRMDGRIRGIGRRKKQDWFGGTALWSANRFGAKILSPNSPFPVSDRGGSLHLGRDDSQLNSCLIR